MRRAHGPLVVVGALALSVAACARPRPATLPPLAAVAIPFSPEELPCCLTLEQTVVVTSPRGRVAFEVVVETHEDAVVLVGFTTYGVRAFLVVHRETGLEVDASTLPEVRGLPFDRVVRDVYAAFLVPPGPDASRQDVRFADRVENGSLRERDVVFDARTESPDVVVVRYGGEGYPLGGDPPADVVVDHAAIGLHIDVTTRRATRSTTDRP